MIPVEASANADAGVHNEELATDTTVGVGTTMATESVPEETMEPTIAAVTTVNVTTTSAADPTAANTTPMHSESMRSMVEAPTSTTTTPTTPRATDYREDRSRMTYSQGALYPLDLYDIGDLVTDKSLEDLKDLFRRYRENRGKSMNVKQESLRQSWNEFIKRLRHERDIESFIQHRKHYREKYSLSALCERVHNECIRDRRPCFAAAMDECPYFRNNNFFDTIEDWDESLRRNQMSPQLSDLVVRLRRALSDSGHGRPVHRTRRSEPRSPPRRPERPPLAGGEAPTYRSWPGSRTNALDSNAYHERWNPASVERRDDRREWRAAYSGGADDPRRSLEYPGDYRSDQRYTPPPSVYGPRSPREREDLPARSDPFVFDRERDYSPVRDSPQRSRHRYHPYGSSSARRSRSRTPRDSPPRLFAPSTREYAAAAPVSESIPTSTPVPVGPPAPSTPPPTRHSVSAAPPVGQSRDEERRPPDQSDAPATRAEGDVPAVTGPVPRWFRETDERSERDADEIAALSFELESLQAARTSDLQAVQQLRNQLRQTNQNLRDLRALVQARNPRANDDEEKKAPPRGK